MQRAIWSLLSLFLSIFLYYFLYRHLVLAMHNFKSSKNLGNYNKKIDSNELAHIYIFIIEE